MIITKYIQKQLYSQVLLISLALLAILLTNYLVLYLNKAAGGQLSIDAVFKIMSLQVPMLLGYIIPLALFLSILTVLSRMCLDSEMTVLNACGMSLTQLITTVMGFSLLVFLFVSWLMIFAAPSLEGYHSQVLQQAKAELSVQKIIPAKFTDLGDDRVIYAGGLDHNHRQLKQVFLASKKASDTPGNLPSWDITTAKSANEQLISKYQGNFIVFNKGNRYQGTTGQKDFTTTQFTKYALLLKTKSKKENLWPGNATIQQLWGAADTDTKAAAVLHWRMAVPISVLIFSLMAIPLSLVSSRQGKFLRFIPAIIIYMIYENLLFMGRTWIQNGTIGSTLGLWWVHAIAIIITIGIYIWHIGFKRMKMLLGFK